jgi:hypothetical protein
MPDLDRYYTPSQTAEMVVAAAEAPTMRVCVDSACGSGNLLRASERLFPSVRCVGVDRDGHTIRRLRAEKPKWVLAQGNLFDHSSWSNPAVFSLGVGCDCVLMNPPFSMGFSKGMWASWNGRLLRCSLSMAHMLTTLTIFRPEYGGAAIVPESLMHSELDAGARNAVAADYAMTVVKELKNSTFKGARANALVLRLLRRREVQCNTRATRQQTGPRLGFAVSLVRGGLPVFEARRDTRGMQFVHSTDIVRLQNGEGMPGHRVRPIARGRIRGHAVLLPRVGIPDRSSFRAVFLEREVQLSDCVIALCCRKEREAQQLVSSLCAQWDALLQLYRGTGARYTTVRRLGQWLGAGWDGKRSF